ncbi:hypothetical protein STIUS_v1c05810 [Spiroplasma sp. TIUS-1]|uniref:hypothetical protein n=1 Tax=Spiroplasma sp. TIUS-1 TaxID=216963 RepID=UPI001397AD90|nr:hypothetical protein [Spiroplasma sp. TIUS-1]QHX36135.1 hypothetical protein STIUS_v1c05810 [Spiroplasma sp. TIUS-1]
MIKLLSLIGSIGISASGFAPVIAGSTNIINKDITESFDISEVNDYITYSPEMSYYQMDINYFSLVLRGFAARGINEARNSNDLNFNDIDIEYIWNIDENRELNRQDVLGHFGAGTRTLEVKVVPSEEGKEKGLIGEMLFINFMKHDYLDLSNSELTNAHYPINIPERWHHETIESIVEQMKIWIYEVYRTAHLGWYTPLAFGPEIFKSQPNLLFNAETGKRFTQNDLDNMKDGETTTLKMVLSPSEYGNEYGVLNTTLYSFDFAKYPNNI